MWLGFWDVAPAPNSTPPRAVCTRGGSQSRVPDLPAGPAGTAHRHLKANTLKTRPLFLPLCLPFHEWPISL